MTYTLALTEFESRFLLHMLEVPEVLLGDEDGPSADVFVRRCGALTTIVRSGHLDLAQAMDREIVYRAAVENTYLADAASEDRRAMTLARLSKMAHGLETKLTVSLGREVKIPRA